VSLSVFMSAFTSQILVILDGDKVFGWQTPASVYSDERYFNKGERDVKKRT
jgi:hypothetical protein